MKWFSDWIKKEYVEPGIARCTGPKMLKNHLVLTAPSEKLLCDGMFQMVMCIFVTYVIWIEIVSEILPKSVLSKCDPCILEPCENGGRCSALPLRTFQCSCAPGFHGDTCRNVVDACYGDPCMNGATCKVTEKGRFR